MDGFTSKIKKDLSNSDSLSFTAILDDRGRAVIPASIRNRFNLKFNSQVLLEFKEKINGRDSVMDSVSVCGTEGAGSNPARGPKNDRYINKKINSKK